MGGYDWLAREARRRERYAEHVDALAVVEAKAAGAGAGAVARCRAQMLTRGWTKRVLIARETEVEWYKLDVAQEAKRVGSQGHKGSRAIKTKLDALDGEQKRLNSLLLPGEPDPHTRMAPVLDAGERAASMTKNAMTHASPARLKRGRTRKSGTSGGGSAGAGASGSSGRPFRDVFGADSAMRGAGAGGVGGAGARRQAPPHAAGVKVEACVRVTHHEKSIS